MRKKYENKQNFQVAIDKASKKKSKHFVVYLSIFFHRMLFSNDTITILD